MKIAVFGGAFNPPHLGHLLIAQQILDFTDCDKIWLLPCFQHQFQKELAPSANRLEMTQFLANGKISVSDFEITNNKSGQTFETMLLLKKQFPDVEFSFVIGSDNLVSFKKWGRWEELILGWQFFVFPRPGFDYDLAKYGLKHPDYRFTLVKNELLATTNISSTLIRKRISQKLPIDFMLPEKVKVYINKNCLYKD